MKRIADFTIEVVAGAAWLVVIGTLAIGVPVWAYVLAGGEAWGWWLLFVIVWWPASSIAFTRILEWLTPEWFT